MNTEFSYEITRKDKETLLSQTGKVIWFYGLSGSGKSTIANALEKELHNQGKLTQILDGDTLRTGLNDGLGFSQEDRKENLRRVAEVAKLFANSGLITICCFITPLIEQREMIKNIIGNDLTFVHINTPLEVCEKRDPKGLYKKARAGEIKNFTGVDSKFESTLGDHLVFDTSNIESIEIVKKLI